MGYLLLLTSCPTSSSLLPLEAPSTIATHTFIALKQSSNMATVHTEFGTASKRRRHREEQIEGAYELQRVSRVHSSSSKLGFTAESPSAVCSQPPSRVS